jgi:hypothetical protein
VVEHRLAKARVAGSSPVSRSKWLSSEPPAAFQERQVNIAGFPQGFKRKSLRRDRYGGNFSFGCEPSRSDLKVARCRTGFYPAGQLQLFKMARYPSGKGEVCKTFMRRFDSDPRLHLKVVENKEQADQA